MTARVRRRPAYRDEGGLADFIDDGGYETGSFTPTFSFDTVGDLSVAYGQQVGSYWRFGGLVFIKYRLQWTPTFTTSSGNAVFGGLPFAVGSTGAGSDGGGIITQTGGNIAYPGSRTETAVHFFGGASELSMLARGSATGNGGFGVSQFPTGTQYTLTAWGFYAL